MRFRRESSEDGAGPRPVSCVVRTLIVVGLAAVIGLFVLVRPLREPEQPSPVVGVESPVPTQASVASATPQTSVLILPTDAGSATATAAPPTATATPSPAPSFTPSATETPTPVPTATATSSNTPTPEPTASAPQPTPAPLVGRVEQGVYLSQVTASQESYRVYLPPGYDQVDRRYPVLYLLHGWPYDESHWDNLGVDEVADARMVGGTLPPFIVVLPGASRDGIYVNTSGGAQSFEEQLVNELMPHIDATYRTVQTRDARAIGGISRGGVWSLEIAFQHADAFGIVGAHSPALSANRAPPVYDPFVLLTQPGVAALRIYLSAGDADWAREETEDLHRALTEQGIPSQYVVHGGGHVDQQWAQHIDEYLTFYAAGW
jgi:enterochelin esterase-like enzyme